MIKLHPTCPRWDCMHENKTSEQFYLASDCYEKVSSLDPSCCLAEISVISGQHEERNAAPRVKATGGVVVRTLTCHHCSERLRVQISSRDIFCTWHLFARLGDGGFFWVQSAKLRQGWSPFLLNKPTKVKARAWAAPLATFFFLPWEVKESV